MFKKILFVTSLCLSAASIHAEVLVDFNELNAYTNTTPTGSYYDGYGFGTAQAGGFESKGITFNTDNVGAGFSYSNVNDTTTPGFNNQWAAITGSGIGGSGNYILGTTSSPNAAFFNIPVNNIINSVFLTNATYTSISLENGDQFAKKFGGQTGNDPDFFRITLTGFDNLDATGIETGATEFFLADYRFADNSLDYIVKDWRFLDLSTLGAARSVGISLDGSDNGAFGLNTPAYVALDNISITAVPESSSLLVLAVAMAGVCLIVRYKLAPHSGSC